MAYTDAELRGILQGYHGGLHIRFRLFESNIYGDKGPIIEGVEEVEISLQNFNDWTWELNCMVTNNRNFNFDSEFVKAECWISLVDSANDDDWHKFPMGLYRFQSPKGSHANATTWELTGVSLEALALGDSEPRGFYVPANSDIIAQCRLILMTMRPSIPASMIDFPKESSPVLLPEATYFDPLNDAEGTRKLRIINTLLNAGGYYSLYTDANGKFKTHKIVDESKELPDVCYSTHPGYYYENYTMLYAHQMIKTEPIVDEYNEENFANRVVVLSGDTNQKPPIYAIAENNDESDPLSIPRLGRIVQGEPITMQSVASYAEAYLVAITALATAKGRYRQTTFHTVPDPRRGVKDRYRMYLMLPSGELAMAGKFRVIGWRLSEEGMEHEVARLEGVWDSPWNDLSQRFYRGVWDAEESYYRRDVVTYQGITFVAIQASRNVTPIEGEFWTDSPEEVTG
jgi:hypothetical protein